MNSLFVQWGGGNIGRSFIGQVFATSGYQVTFIDINKELINVLNESHEYVVQSVDGEKTADIRVKNVDAIDANDQKIVNETISKARLMGVSVGKNVWPHIAEGLSKAIEYRYSKKPEEPIDIILAENIHNASTFVTDLLSSHLPKDFPVREYIGLIETSIGKMVPIQDMSNLLKIKAEPYNELIVDKDRFKNPIPDNVIPLHPVSPISAYVDRKLFIHNLGHATAAYLGFKKHPKLRLIAQVIEDETIRADVRAAMIQSSEILQQLYPAVFTQEDLTSHIDDLLNRFANKALGDTVYRVGRDLRRKLRFDDRLMGIIIEAEKKGLPWDSIGKVYLAALSFKATDTDGNMFESDKQALEHIESLSLKEKILNISCWEESNLGNELFENISEKMKDIT